MKYLPDLLTLRHRCPLFHLSVRSSVCLSLNSSVMSKFDIYVKVSILINYNSITTIIPCMTHLPDLLTWQICWPSDLDLYFALHWLWHNIDVPDLLNYKAYNYQTLHTASPRCTDLAGTLIWWPWPIFCAPVILTYFASTFNILNYKAYNHQTLQSASPQCTDLAVTLTYILAAVTLT